MRSPKLRWQIFYHLFYGSCSFTLSTYLRRIAESSQTAHLVELDSGSTKSELRGHDNVVEAAILIPVSCLPAIRELLGQKVSSYYLSITHPSNISRSRQQLRVVCPTMRISRMQRQPRVIRR